MRKFGLGLLILLGALMAISCVAGGIDGYRAARMQYSQQPLANMCKAPILLPNGQATACHECQQCRQQAINDWVGRNIAESKTAVAASAVTLTYGKGRAGDVDHERAAILTYSDIQKFLKLLRRHGHPVRYFIAGEYGSKKGRAHWHAILYWQGKKPDVVLRQNVLDPFWIEWDGKNRKGEPRGFTFWDEVTPATVLYCAKYVQADKTDDARQGMVRMSKKPPLGTAYFQRLAEKYVEQGIAPQSLEYTFPGVMWTDKGNKVPWRFRLKDRPAEMFLEHYVEQWRQRHGKRHFPSSEIVEEFLDHSAWRGEPALDRKPMTREELRLRSPTNPIIGVGHYEVPVAEWTPEMFEGELQKTEEVIAAHKRGEFITRKAREHKRNG